MTLPKLSIGIITYNRPVQFGMVMESMFNYIRYPRELITLVIVDDKSDSDYVSTYSGFYGETIVIRQQERGGMQKSWNTMHRVCSNYSDLILANQDDWLLTEPLDLRLAVMFMAKNPIVGMVRYHKLSGHVGLPSVIRQWNSKEGITNFVDSPHEYDPSLMTWCELLPPFDGSNTYSPYSGGVHLRHKGFTEFYGEYEEGIKFSEAELKYFERVNAGMRDNLNVCPRIAIFPHYFLSRFKDISEYSYRDTPVEAETLK